MKRLEVLGWWFNEHAPTGLPRPQLLIAPMEPSQRAAVASYLRAGKALVRHDEPSHCRFQCGETEMGRADLTDGTFVWPEGLVHYVERHDVRLPDRFKEHAVANGGAVPNFVMPKPAFGLFDTGPWLAWGRAQGACLDLDGFEIPTGTILDKVARDLGPVPHEAILLCRGSTREVVLLLPGGVLEVRQLREGGNPPRQLAGFHEWPRATASTRDDSAAAKPPSKPGRGLSMDAFFAERKKTRAPDES